MCVCVCVLVDSVVPDSVTTWIISCQAPLSVEFSRQEYSSGLPFPSPGDLPDPGIKTGSPTLLADSLPYEPPRSPSLPYCLMYWFLQPHWIKVSVTLDETIQTATEASVSMPVLFICITFFLFCYNISNYNIKVNSWGKILPQPIILYYNNIMYLKASQYNPLTICNPNKKL